MSCKFPWTTTSTASLLVVQSGSSAMLPNLRMNLNLLVQIFQSKRNRPLERKKKKL